MVEGHRWDIRCDDVHCGWHASCLADWWHVSGEAESRGAAKGLTAFWVRVHMTSGPVTWHQTNQPMVLASSTGCQCRTAGVGGNTGPTPGRGIAAQVLWHAHSRTSSWPSFISCCRAPGVPAFLPGRRAGSVDQVLLALGTEQSSYVVQAVCNPACMRPLQQRGGSVVWLIASRS